MQEWDGELVMRNIMEKFQRGYQGETSPQMNKPDSLFSSYLTASMNFFEQDHNALAYHSERVLVPLR